MGISAIIRVPEYFGDMEIPRQNDLSQLAENARFVEPSKCCTPSAGGEWNHDKMESR